MRIKIEQQRLVRAKISEYDTKNHTERLDLTPARLRHHLRQIVRRDYPGIEKTDIERIVELRIKRGMTQYITVDLPVRHVDHGTAAQQWQDRRTHRLKIAKLNHDNRRS